MNEWKRNEIVTKIKESAVRTHARMYALKEACDEQEKKKKKRIGVDPLILHRTLFERANRVIEEYRIKLYHQLATFTIYDENGFEAQCFYKWLSIANSAF